MFRDWKQFKVMQTLFFSPISSPMNKIRSPPLPSRSRLPPCRHCQTCTTWNTFWAPRGLRIWRSIKTKHTEELQILSGVGISKFQTLSQFQLEADLSNINSWASGPFTCPSHFLTIWKSPNHFVVFSLKKTLKWYKLQIAQNLGKLWSKLLNCWLWQNMSVVLALGRRRQEDCSESEASLGSILEFKASLNYASRHHLKIKNK